ncbi:MAG: GNAT family N-acetyltransferase [Ruminococcus sp.]
MKIEIIKQTPEHKAELIEICNGADRRFLSDRLPYPYTEADADRWLDNVKNKEEKGEGLFRFVAVDGKAVGTITFEKADDIRKRDGELGYMLLNRYHGKGIMTEAARLLCNEAFEKLDIIRITAMVYEPNTASRRVLEKNGFELEGLLKNAVTKDGNTLNLCIFGKLK